MSRQIEGIVSTIAELSAAERAELKRQLARLSWWAGETQSQAAEAQPDTLSPDFVVVFDGGSRGNPGPGYGSYLLLRNRDGAQMLRRLHFGADMTSNEAEYDTLIAALGELKDWIAEDGLKPEQASVEIRGDSQLVVRQVTGRWRALDSRMAERRDQVRAIMRGFAEVRVVRQPRAESVRLLGH